MKLFISTLNNENKVTLNYITNLEYQNTLHLKKKHVTHIVIKTGIMLFRQNCSFPRFIRCFFWVRNRGAKIVNCK